MVVAKAAMHQTSSLIEPLSDREMEVLESSG